MEPEFLVRPTGRSPRVSLACKTDQTALIDPRRQRTVGTLTPSTSSSVCRPPALGRPRGPPSARLGPPPSARQHVGGLPIPKTRTVTAPRPPRRGKGARGGGSDDDRRKRHRPNGGGTTADVGFGSEIELRGVPSRGSISSRLGARLDEGDGGGGRLIALGPRVIDGGRGDVPSTSEEEEDDTAAPPPALSCRFFAAGRCRHGGACRYRHEKEGKVKGNGVRRIVAGAGIGGSVPVTPVELRRRAAKFQSAAVVGGDNSLYDRPFVRGSAEEPRTVHALRGALALALRGVSSGDSGRDYAWASSRLKRIRAELTALLSSSPTGGWEGVDPEFLAVAVSTYERVPKRQGC